VRSFQSGSRFGTSKLSCDSHYSNAFYKTDFPSPPCPLSPQIRTTLETNAKSLRPNLRGEGELDAWWRRSGVVMTLLLASLICFSGCAQSPSAEQVAKAEPQSTEAVPIKPEVLFDGKTIDRWELTSFGGEGDCYVKDGAIVLSAGDPITAINLPEEYDLPTDDYEIVVEAKRVAGTDFFATVTFPVGDSFCSLVVGGWAGTIIGLSSIDGEDASTEDNISAWIDDEKVVDLNTVGRKISLRGEMIPCRPLGIATYITTAAIRKVELLRLESKTDAYEAQGK